MAIDTDEELREKVHEIVLCIYTGRPFGDRGGCEGATEEIMKLFKLYRPTDTQELTCTAGDEDREEK